MGIPRRGLREIRTLAGKVDRVTHPYMAYMQITCLEMERARRSLERQSTMCRIQTIDARIRDIEKEKGSLIEALAQRTASSEARAAAMPCEARGAAEGRGQRGLKVRY